MRENNCEVVPALLRIANTSVFNDGMGQVMFFAAAVEIIEPSN